MPNAVPIRQGQLSAIKAHQTAKKFKIGGRVICHSFVLPERKITFLVVAIYWYLG